MVWIVGELTNVVWIILLGEFNGDNIGIQGLDMVWIQVGVTEVRVDLSGVLDTGSGDSERFSSPLVVIFLGLLRNIDSWERPSQDGDWTRQHTLHWLGSDGLGIDGFLDGHWGWSRNITDNDWWSDVSGTVGLDPTVGGEGETLQLFTKVLNHIVSLWFTVNQNVQVDFFLESDNLFDFGLNELLVGFWGELTLGKLVSVDSDVLGLWEGTNGGGWEQWQLVNLFLFLDSFDEWGGTTTQLVGDLSDSLLDSSVVGDGGFGSGLDGGSVGGEGFRDIFTRNVLGNNNNFVQLLGGKGEEIFNFSRQLLFVVQVNWSVQQRRRGGNDNSVGTQLGNSSLSNGRGSSGIGLPDVSTVNNTDRQLLFWLQSGNDTFQLFWSSDQIDVDGSNWSRLDSFNVWNNSTKVSGQGDFW
ncbi:hypothetical protein WICPIJ_009159 [Wickerhamomyces pijperi]|uniref:Uncharacterized protein n=1 Tax=Wickerhamomyces pijperi TaxID=599730 RepID=A0A9P8PRR9_WICPI|nr:hypothetical protein WICPIJ_009159 [Wickerhamomyces pijperi]